MAADRAFSLNENQQKKKDLENEIDSLDNKRKELWNQFHNSPEYLSIMKMMAARHKLTNDMASKKYKETDAEYTGYLNLLLEQDKKLANLDSANLEKNDSLIIPEIKQLDEKIKTISNEIRKLSLTINRDEENKKQSIRDSLGIPEIKNYCEKYKTEVFEKLGEKYKALCKKNGDQPEIYLPNTVVGIVDRYLTQKKNAVHPEDSALNKYKSKYKACESLLEILDDKKYASEADRLNDFVSTLAKEKVTLSKHTTKLPRFLDSKRGPSDGAIFVEKVEKALQKVGSFHRPKGP